MNILSCAADIKNTAIIMVDRKTEFLQRERPEVHQSINAVREGNEEMKATNYYRCPQAIINPDCPRIRKAENLLPNNKVLLDYDQHYQGQELFEKIKPHLKDLNIIHAELSCRGGLHLIVPRIEGRTILETILAYEYLLGVQLDHKTQDIARAVYLVPNKMVLYAEDRYY